MTALAKGYEFFTFYLTLVMTPMFILLRCLLSHDQSPCPHANVRSIFPLTHAVALIRPLVVGQPVIDAWLHAGVWHFVGSLAPG
ncbi:MAG: hypothetical protein Ct9H300mP14_02450 [Gammaproteobacteria bacterium]|nr:MAG: hypothetical protein Ct9H300mP14_02450 [Gammaproteobacteria bacterium]